jgi:hypothetical protein
MFGTPARAIAPKIGNAPLAAFLKKSLRDWRLSSFFFFSSISMWLENLSSGSKDE